MKILIYRKKEDNSIYRMQDLEDVLSESRTIEFVESQIVKFNETNEKLSCEIHEVPEGEEEIVSMALIGDMLFSTDIMHKGTDEVPANTYIYAFYKHDGHDTLTIEMMKSLRNSFVLPNIVGKKGRLPIAWCKAKDLYTMLGFNKRVVKDLWAASKSEAWAWYERED